MLFLCYLYFSYIMRYFTLLIIEIYIFHIYAQSAINLINQSAAYIIIKNMHDNQKHDNQMHKVSN